MNRRVVITGMGAVTPVGLSVPEFCRSLKEGKPGDGEIRSFDTGKHPFKNAFEVKGFDPHKYRAHLLDPFIQYAVAATTEALGDASFDVLNADPYRIGISVSSSKGGVHTMDRFLGRFQKNPSALLGARIYTNLVPNFAAQWIARRWKVKGPAKCYIAACATGSVAVMEGARMVADGTVDYCIAGASDASVVPLMLAGYKQMKALSPDRMRPFDKERSGFLVGEGAGIVFLETLESAKARKVKIVAEIIAANTGNDISDGIHFDRQDTALSRTLKQLLQKADIAPGDVDYINLHGTGTRVGDVYETEQIKAAFGKEAYHIPMSSTKSMTGHMLGASGAVEVIASALSLRDQFVPPTVNLDRADDACDLNYLPGKAERTEVKTAVTLSMGFGGHVAALALRKI